MHARAAAERQAINTAVQGSAADLVKGAMNKIESRVAEVFPQCRVPLRPSRGRHQGCTFTVERHQSIARFLFQIFVIFFCICSIPKSANESSTIIIAPLECQNSQPGGFQPIGERGSSSSSYHRKGRRRRGCVLSTADARRAHLRGGDPRRHSSGKDRARLHGELDLRGERGDARQHQGGAVLGAAADTQSERAVKSVII